MPTTRRKQSKPTGPTASTRAQSKLSFNNKSARVTKPSVSDPNVKKSILNPSKSEQTEIEDLDLTPEIKEDEEDQLVVTEEVNPVEEESSEEKNLAIRQSPATPKSKTITKPIKKTEEKEDTREVEARKVTDVQLKKYWKAEEDSRLAPRVHQKDVPLHEKILRHFDLSSQYGPCIGIQRMARWKRANKLGLNPPVEVLAVLIKEENKSTSQGCGKIAYIDELAGGRVVLVE